MEIEEDTQPTIPGSTDSRETPADPEAVAPPRAEAQIPKAGQRH